MWRKILLVLNHSWVKLANKMEVLRVSMEVLRVSMRGREDKTNQVFGVEKIRFL
jgi:hypothetical protein